MKHVDLSSLGVTELLALSASCLSELRARGVVRTGNAPLGDYSEWLALQAFGGELAPNSERSFDLTTASGMKIQVKSRRVSLPPRAGQLQSSPFRSWGFDLALFMLLHEDTYEVLRASLVPVEIVREMSRYVPHVNGSNAYMTDDLMAHAEAEDVVDLLRVASGDAHVREATREQNRAPGSSRRLRPATATPPPDVRDRIDDGSVETWLWLANGAIDEFKRWRVAGGATTASAASYASGARAYVQYWRVVGDSGESFESHLRRTRGVSPRAIGSYQTHAREFLRFLHSTGRLPT